MTFLGGDFSDSQVAIHVAVFVANIAMFLLAKLLVRWLNQEREVEFQLTLFRLLNIVFLPHARGGPSFRACVSDV